MKLIYDIEFPSNVLYSLNYYFDDNEDDKFTEYIYGTNDTEHIERNIDLPSSFTSSDHKLHYFFNATGLTTETFENSFSLIYHKPTIHLLTDNDRSNLPIYIRSVNDTIRIRVKIEDDDLNDNVTSIASIESTSICQTISKIAPYSNEFQIVPSFDELNEGIIFVTIYAVDEHGNNASKNESFYFEYKYNKPEIEFQSESNISRIGNFIRIKCRVRYYRKGGVLKIETNITNDDFISTNVKEYFIEDDLFNDINIDIPINQFYEGNYSISICVSNEHDEISHFMTSKFTLDDIPTLEDLPEIKKFKHYNKFTPFIFSSISK
ncbi:hypothetical protein TVAGG3_0208690 [Trichomonas vaginalis G3]|uniref:hypothetical protein n=1 Tax=Trichomonas vaginalis (strain ATCC PRA-98 / G3) TaxID=412133 RepID=UPI0021E5C4E4|nr:hypothetical protein TVAGG3_0208690 [Trichomonas vaginalis G3]KAI5551088.1 hypothetical protein TVAGG3_0208690 [Trichomonas vaginalis G3]